MSHRNVTLHSLLMQLATTVRDLCQRQIDKSRLLENLNLDAIVLYLLRENGLASDFDQQLLACVDAMAEPDAIGQTLVLQRSHSELQLHQIDTRSLLDADLRRYEMVLFDGGSRRKQGRWKHVFFPASRVHWFVHDNG